MDRAGQQQVGASGAVTWVAQAGPAWSAVHLEEGRERIAARMLPMPCAATGTRPDDARHAAAHRWRFAQVTAPLGTPCLAAPEKGMWLGGDWHLRPRAGDARTTGTATGRTILPAAA